jgi:hypothetical protein
MPFESREFLVLDTPEFNGFVPTSRSNCLAVRAETNAADLIGMPVEGREFLAL